MDDNDLYQHSTKTDKITDQQGVVGDMMIVYVLSYSTSDERWAVFGVYDTHKKALQASYDILEQDQTQERTYWFSIVSLEINVDQPITRVR